MAEITIPATVGRLIRFLDSEQFLGQAATWSALALQFGTGPMLIMNGFLHSRGLPFIMTAPTLFVFLFRSRYGQKKRLATTKSDLSGLLVWGLLFLQSVAYGAPLS